MKTIHALLMTAAVLASLNATAQPTVTSVLPSASLFEPFGITGFTNNSFYLTDGSHRIWAYNPDQGSLTALAGANRQPGYTDGLGFLARFYSPKGIVAYQGGLVVADSANHLLRFISWTNGISLVSTFAGFTNLPGSPIDGPLSTARFNTPLGLAVDGSNNLYVADSRNNAIRKISPVNGDLTQLQITTVLSTNLSQPSALAVDPQGNVYVADTKNNGIKLLVPQLDGISYQTLLLAGSPLLISGTNDDYFARNALFNAPAGLQWIGGTIGLLVSDTANHTLRSVYINNALSSIFSSNVWSVTNYAGLPGRLGYVDGPANQARFYNPLGTAVDNDGGLLIVDSGNGALRRIQIAPPKVPLPDPVIGVVSWVTNDVGILVTRLIPFNDATFYTDTNIIAVLGEPNNTYYTFGNTPGLFESDLIPVPSPGFSEPVLNYHDGMTVEEVPRSLFTSGLDLTLKVIASTKDRKPSGVVTARIQFKVAPPTIIGNNPSLIKVTEDTPLSQIYYTIDGTEPTENSSQPSPSGTVPLLSVYTNFTFRTRAFKFNFQPSEITSRSFSPTNFAATQISFGFSSGEASSVFIGAAGKRFYAPITLTLNPLNQSIYSLQFNVTVTNLNGAPPMAGTPNELKFDTMLLKPIPNTQPPVYTIIPPGYMDDFLVFHSLVFANFANSVIVTNNNLVYTNLTNNLLGVGWVEARGKTNLYDTTKQDLITYSQAHDTMFLGKAGRIILGSFSFPIPSNAADNQIYEINLGRPSATADGIAEDVFIDAPTNGSLTIGAINARKQVVVGQAEYLVGDVSPFRWLNAGDFGKKYLLDSDVEQVFRGASGINVPPNKSDFYDAMDASDGSGSLDGNDTHINDIVRGDGFLLVDDLYVVWRRSLDPSLANVVRYYANGVQNYRYVPNYFRWPYDQPPRPTLLHGPTASKTSQQADLPAEALTLMSSTEAPNVIFSADDFQVQPGQAMHVPIQARIAGKYPIRVLLLHLVVQPLDGSPALANPVCFTPTSRLGQPTMADSGGPNSYAAVWLNNSVAGVWGTNAIGFLDLTIPTNATPGSAYKIAFQRISASPNGLGLLPQQVNEGLLLLSNRLASSCGDSIPDTWRLRFFGSISNVLADARADADGDGIPNWAEFKAGTNPTDIKSALRLRANHFVSGQPSGSTGLTLNWPTVLGKTYAIEYTTSLVDPEWLPLAANITGTGGQAQIVDGNASAAVLRYYRVRLVEP